MRHFFLSRFYILLQNCAVPPPSANLTVSPRKKIPTMLGFAIIVKGETRGTITFSRFSFNNWLILLHCLPFHSRFVKAAFVRQSLHGRSSESDEIIFQRGIFNKEGFFQPSPSLLDKPSRANPFVLFSSKVLTLCK